MTAAPRSNQRIDTTPRRHIDLSRRESMSMMTKIIVSRLAFTVLGGALALAQGSKPQATNSANARAMNLDRCPFIHLLSRCFGAHEQDQSGAVVGNKKMEWRRNLSDSAERVAAEKVST